MRIKNRDKYLPLKFIGQALWACRWLYALWAYGLACEIHHYWH